MIKKINLNSIREVIKTLYELEKYNDEVNEQCIVNDDNKENKNNIESDEA